MTLLPLPPLPSQLAAFASTQVLHCAHNDLVQAYGQQCREAALDEAAQSLLEAGFRSTGIPAYESLAERVRKLK